MILIVHISHVDEGIYVLAWSDKRQDGSAIYLQLIGREYASYHHVVKYHDLSHVVNKS